MTHQKRVARLLAFGLFNFGAYIKERAGVKYLHIGARLYLLTDAGRWYRVA
jgi:hypothetical protein